jgi:hypothetical protein
VKLLLSNAHHAEQDKHAVAREWFSRRERHFAARET